MNVQEASKYLRTVKGITREQRIQILQNAGLIKSVNGVNVANRGVNASIKTVTKSLLAQAAAWAKTPFGMVKAFLDHQIVLKPLKSSNMVDAKRFARTKTFRGQYISPMKIQLHLQVQ